LFCYNVRIQIKKNVSRMNKITFIAPDDWHCHFRDDNFLARTVKDTASRFQRAIIMPNLVPPINTVIAAKAYRQRIEQHIPAENPFKPLMTLYLTDDMTAEEICNGKTSGEIAACKLYPAGATTHSAAGVSNLKGIYPLLETMQSVDLPLLIHGEVVNPEIDVFDREAVFIDTLLAPLVKDFPNLRIVLEHISTKRAVEFVSESPSNVAATITPQHISISRNDLLVGGIRPHLYCLPIVKKQIDKEALVKAATSGNPKFFLGTDSAPHSQSSKESHCGCAGIYTSHAAIEIYASLFEQHNSLDKLEGFASQFGPRFYHLPENKTTITLIKKPWKIPGTLSFGDTTLVPFLAEQTVNWQIDHDK
jgi:dihydroorotase